MISRIASTLLLAAVLLAAGGCAGSRGLALGDAPLTVTVQADSEDFDGRANVYINNHFIGTTDPRRQNLQINLKKGEYTIHVTAPGYSPWVKTITLLGNDYSQTVLARLDKKEQ